MTPDRKGDIFEDQRLRAAQRYVVATLAELHPHHGGILSTSVNLMRQCGTYLVGWYIDEGGSLRLIRNQCKARGCPICETLRAARIRRELIGEVERKARNGSVFSMITLTVSHQLGDSLSKLMTLLRDALRRFVRSKQFKRHVHSRVRSFEVTWGDNGFHPHVHMLIEAKYWNMYSAKELWRQCVLRAGGPDVGTSGLNIIGINDLGKGLREAAGYPVKTTDLTKMPPLALCELLIVLKGKRLVQAGGNWGTLVRRAEDRNEFQDAVVMAGGQTVFKLSRSLRLARQGEEGIARNLAYLIDHLRRANVMLDTADHIEGILKASASEHGWLKPARHERPQGASL